MDVRNTQIVDVPEARHYALIVNGEQVGFTAYRLNGNTITFTHTETSPDLQGHGLGSELVRGALDDVRRRGLQVVPQCPFVRAWIDEHPECAELLKK